MEICTATETVVPELNTFVLYTPNPDFFEPIRVFKFIARQNFEISLFLIGCFVSTIDA